LKSIVLEQFNIVSLIFLFIFLITFVFFISVLDKHSKHDKSEREEDGRGATRDRNGGDHLQNGDDDEVN
jgi:hypothetical protein